MRCAVGTRGTPSFTASRKPARMRAAGRRLPVRGATRAVRPVAGAATGVPRRVRRRDIINGRLIRLVRPRNIYVRKVPRLIRRSLCDLSFLGSRNSHNVLILDEFSQVGELSGRGLDDVRAFRLVRRRLVAAVDQRHAGRVFVTFDLHRAEIALEIFFTDLFELGEVDVDALGLLEHRLEFVRPENKIIGTCFFLLVEPRLKFTNGFRCRRVRILKILCDASSVTGAKTVTTSLS